MRTPRERSGTAICPRDERGRLLPLDALVRFQAKCRFEPETGCVVWTGGQTSGRGHNVPYGSFWFEGRRWFAHRWAAKFIHGQAIDGFQTDHYCPHIPLPNTLCVEHLQPLTLGENRELQTARRFDQRKRFIHIEVGLETYEAVYGPIVLPDSDTLIPFHNPPTWLGIFHERPTDRSDDDLCRLPPDRGRDRCPF